MLIIRSTHDILHNPWKNNFSDCTQTTIMKLPPSWQSQQEITVDDVIFWEQLYFQPGNIGIYISWNPYTEFYMVVHNLYSYATHGIKTFNGNFAHKKLLSYIAPFKINLEEKKIWVESTTPRQ